MNYLHPLMQTDFTNTQFQLASDLVNYTAQNIFLTGKAGTGKTTFLKHIRESTAKKTAVVAPTGVAAINAGGVTMHSFFLLPFEPFLPVRGGWNAGYANQSNLFGKIKLSSARREVMEELELLIMDEVSMVRCDKLDATDAILKYVRRSSLPFGGVQVLLIGDLFQLPPVAKEEEWAILKDHYASPFFFHSKIIQQYPPLHIELKKIYRQKEQQFIGLLNNIRNNTMHEYDFEMLQSRYNPQFVPPPSEGYITVTTHNYKADNINNAELNKLPGRAFIYNGIVEGEFNESSFPTELHLTLKEGAQVMFIKNDSGEHRRYYNGKLARIQKLSAEEIIVVTNDEQAELKLEIEEWKNIKYNFNKEKNVLEEEVLGKFRQYPIRLAWAITIHKSQGLTFEKVIIDAGQSFAAGQVYVALSRCTTLEGMVLLSAIRSHVINTDERVLTYSDNKHDEHFLSGILLNEKRKFMTTQLIQAFDYNKILHELDKYKAYIPGKNIPEKAETIAMSGRLLSAAQAQAEVARKFREKIPALIEQYENDHSPLLEEKMRNGIDWFARSLAEEVIYPLHAHYTALTYSSKVKQYKKYVSGLLVFLQGQLKKIYSARYGEMMFTDPASFENFLPRQIDQKEGKRKTKPEKGDSKKLSLALFQQGLGISEIAHTRNLTESTVEGHLADFVLTGDIAIYTLIAKEKVNALLEILELPGIHTVADVKNKTGNKFSYGQIKAVMYHCQRIKAT
ncbi:MAG: helix-turn-helix domain-containing protein, partial [Chitinophagales bacterium]